MKITQLDHLVLTVKNIEITVSFYTSVLGMKKEVFGEGRIALKFGEQKINLHTCDDNIQPRAMHATPGSADLCFITDVPLDTTIKAVKFCGIEIIQGPVERTGARGKILSFYVRDPDGNLIEIATEL
ncbi:MAG: VOC family protein [Nitrospirota bacterium]|nr:VOC family protein [Nitrospirota bacterium]